MIRELDAVGRTALLAAACRAAESSRADRLFEDPYAERLAGQVGGDLLDELDGMTYPAAGERRMFDTTALLAIRTRLFDDLLQRGAADPGMTQIVLAAAGMDSRAYRLAWPDHVRCFEIDRPAVLKYKKNCLADVRPRVELHSVAADLLTDEWEDDLRAAGYDPELPSMWLLEGLLYYLPEADTHRLLDRVAAVTSPGSRIAADICNTTGLTFPDWQPMWTLLAELGAPALFGHDDPVELLAMHGFSAQAIMPGDGVTADFERWEDSVPPSSQNQAPRFFYVIGDRQKTMGRPRAQGQGLNDNRAVPAPQYAVSST
nr:SAM-dependent methyltransferase [Streptomyces sp. NBC_00998]